MAMGQRQLRIDVGKYPIEFGHGIELGLFLIDPAAGPSSCSSSAPSSSILCFLRNFHVFFASVLIPSGPNPKDNGG
jgi:hypothetical protein